MKRFALALARLLGTAVVLPAMTATPADAQSKCHYTSSDQKKGYRC